MVFSAVSMQQAGSFILGREHGWKMLLADVKGFCVGMLGVSEIGDELGRVACGTAAATAFAGASRRRQACVVQNCCQRH